MNKIRVSQGITINIGHYQSYRIDIEYAKDFEDEEKREEVYNELTELVENKLREKIKEKAKVRIVEGE